MCLLLALCKSTVAGSHHPATGTSQPLGEQCKPAAGLAAGVQCGHEAQISCRASVVSEPLGEQLDSDAQVLCEQCKPAAL